MHQERAKHMTILGCDYSTKYVNLAWKEEAEWQYPRIAVDGDLGQFLFDLKHELPAHISREKFGQLYIERPWSRYNPGTAMQLQRIATIVDVVATQAGYETHWVAIAEWRSKIFGKGKYDSKTAKQMAVNLVKERFDIVADDNTADAICLALYGEMK